MSNCKNRLFADKYDNCDFNSEPQNGIRKKRLKNEGLFLTADTQQLGNRLFNNFIPLESNLSSESLNPIPNSSRQKLKPKQKEKRPSIRIAPSNSEREHDNQKLFEKKELGWSLIVDSISNLPVVAFWVVDELSKLDYSQLNSEALDDDCSTSLIDKENGGKESVNVVLNEIEADESSSSTTNIADSVYIIENNLDLYTESFRKNGVTHPETLRLKTTLIDSLKLFPFSAALLKRISETLIFKGKDLGLIKTGSLQLNECLEKNQFKFLDTADNNLSEAFLVDEKTLQGLLEKIYRGYRIWIESKQQLVINNEKLVLYVANQYKGDFMEFTDIAQEGQIGLLKAVDKFDFRLGYKFSTYAIYWIRSTISRSLSKSERTVRLPFRRMASIKKIFQCIEEQKSTNGEAPGHQELAEMVNLSNEDLSSMLSISPKPVSLDAKLSPDDENTTLLSYMEQNVFSHPMSELSERDLKDLLGRAIETLSKNESHIVNCRFGLDRNDQMTLQEIGDELSLTRERVRQIQCSALKKIKRSFGSELSNFL